MRKFLVTFLVICAATMAFADEDETPAENQIRLILEQASEVGLADLSVGDLTQTMALLSVAQQQREHVKHSARFSAMVPGLGQYVNGELGRGLIFAAADLVVGVAAAALAYWLLPPAVQWRNLNYLQTPIVDIETRWKALTPGELIPSVAVAASGSLVGLVIRRFASEDAATLARARISEGSIVFESDFLLD